MDWRRFLQPGFKEDFIIFLIAPQTLSEELLLRNFLTKKTKKNAPSYNHSPKKKKKKKTHIIWYWL